MKPKLRQVLTFLLFTALSLLALCLPAYNEVFPEGKAIRLIGPDPYFHLRHVTAVLSHYPVVERHDYMTNFPDGEIGLNQGFFDVFIASIVKATGNHLSPTVVLAWVSPLCLIAVAFLIYIWFLKGLNPKNDPSLSERCATLFLLFFLLYPGSLSTVATLGQGDHHLAEVLLAALVAISLYYFLRPSAGVQLAPLAALPLFIFYLTWPGAPLHLLIVGIIFYTKAWQKPASPQKDTNLAAKGAAYGGSLLLSILLIHILVPWAIIWSLSEKIFVLGSCLLLMGYPILVKIAHRPWARPAFIAIAIVVVSAVIALLIPSTRGPLLELFLPRTRQIAEHVPFSLAGMYRWYGLTWLLAFVAPIQLWRRKDYWDGMVPSIYGLLLFFFWWQTFDYVYYTPAIIAAAAAYTLGTLTWRRELGILLVIIAAIPLIPIGEANRPWANSEQITSDILFSDGLEDASNWLKAQKDPSLKPKDFPYGLVCPWDLGNILSETAGIPVGWSETASTELAWLLFRTKPDKAYKELTGKAKPFRYILLPANNLSGKFLGEASAARLRAPQLYKKGVKIQVGSKTQYLLTPNERNKSTLIYRLYNTQAENLGHYRLVYESPQQVLQLVKLLGNDKFTFFSYPVTPKELAGPLKPLLTSPLVPFNTPKGLMVDATLQQEVKIFELVPGAIIEGHARPLSEVKATLALYAPSSGSRWTGLWSTLADKKGSFRLRLPYPTAPNADLPAKAVQAQGPYKLSIDGKEQTQLVEESDIQNERLIKL